MSKNKTNKLILIGSGPAGLTAAIYAARANLEPLIIEGKTPGGQLMNTSAVENWPGNKTIMGPQLMINMREHAQSFGTQFLSQEIVKVDFSQRPFTLWTDKETELKAESIIIATGARPKKLGIPGEEQYWGKGVSVCAVCDGAFYPDKNVIVVGGGDTAAEDASFLTKFTNKVTMIHIQDKLTASPAMQKRVLDNPKINVIYNSTVTEIIGDDSHVTHTMITNQKNNESKKMSVDGVFIAIGHVPNTTMLKGHLELDERNYVKVTDQTHTSIEGIFVAGDVADYRYRQAITAAGAGCMAALDAQRWLSK